MKTLSIKLRIGICLAAALVSGTAFAQDKADQLAVIVGKSSKLEDISSADLQKYFKAEKGKTPDGTKIVIVMLDVGRPERDAALKGIYKLSENDYNDFFVSATFTGAVTAAPKALPSPAAMKKYVGDTPGAIGYLRASEATDEVKVLKIDGKSPGDPAYSLKMK